MCVHTYIYIYTCVSITCVRRYISCVYIIHIYIPVCVCVCAATWGGWWGRTASQPYRESLAGGQVVQLWHQVSALTQHSPFAARPGWKVTIFFFFFFNTFCCPNYNFSHGKFGSLFFPRKASCNRVALPYPNWLKCMLDIFPVSIIHRTLTWTTGSITCVRDYSYACMYCRHRGCRCRHFI